MNITSPFPVDPQGQQHYHLAQQPTLPLPAISSPVLPAFTPIPDANGPPPLVGLRRHFKRILAIAVVLVAAIVIYFMWNPPTFTATSPGSPGAGITQQSFNSSSFSPMSTATTSNLSSTSGATIQAYIVGAVKVPGVYALPTGSRVYQLLQAAGGPLPKANLVALNLAAALTDGEEVYVTVFGEIPPTYMGGVPGPGNGSPTSGQLVNINTASLTEMQQSLHISSKTAQSIIDYRQQNGPYTSVDQLLQVVSKSIYTKIKSLVTV